MKALDRLKASGRVAESAALGPLTTYKFGGLARYMDKKKERTTQRVKEKAVPCRHWGCYRRNTSATRYSF